jgi:hypothetical protein
MRAAADTGMAEQVLCYPMPRLVIVMMTMTMMMKSQGE